jgi:hypothetical protein
MIGVSTANTGQVALPTRYFVSHTLSLFLCRKKPTRYIHMPSHNFLRAIARKHGHASPMLFPEKETVEIPIKFRLMTNCVRGVGFGFFESVLHLCRRG